MSEHLHEQFDTMEQQYNAATLGMWIFLATEILFFGGLFAAYVVNRYLFPAEFEEGSRHMDVILGTTNTAILLLSSLAVVLALHAAQTGARGRLTAFLLLTILLGLAFLGIKAYEYWHHFHEHLFPGPDFQLKEPHDASVNPRMVQLFFSLYFASTGLHALHMVVGIGLFGVVAFAAWRGRITPEYYTPVEISGLYWHFVDIVWVFLFPFYYLIATGR